MSTAPARMQAISQRTFGGPEVLEVVELDRPEPGPDEVLLRVCAVGVNPADWKIRNGQVPLFGDPPFVLGFDVSGVVEKVGSNVTRFAVGDEVHGMPTPPARTYAEYVTAPADDLAHKPAHLDHAHAAALPAVGLTAWQAVVDIARTGAGQRMLIHAASGGVGHIAVQLAKAHGAYVVAVGRAGNHEFLRGLGADEVVDYTTQDVATAVTGMDVVVDLLGGPNGPLSLRSLRPGGLLVTTIWDNPGVDGAQVQRQGFRLGVVQVAPSASTLDRIDELVTSGQLSVHVEQVLPLTEAGKAHEISERGRVRGKLVLEI